MEDRPRHRSPTRQYLAISLTRLQWRSKAAEEWPPRKTDCAEVAHFRKNYRIALPASPRRSGLNPEGYS